MVDGKGFDIEGFVWDTRAGMVTLNYGEGQYVQWMVGR
jgi:hypothetical protein